MFYGLGVVLVRILFLFPVLGDSITVIDQYVAADTVILPVNALGLANRLRIMASAYSIAVRANRSLTVVWQRNEDCMAPFTDLYLMPTGINVVDWDELSDNAAFSTSVRRAIRSSAAEKGLTVAEGYPRNFIYGLDDTSRGMVSILWTRGTHAPSAADCNGYLADKVQFYQHLHLVPAVEQLIQSIELRWGQGRLVGVHIRAFDERYDWAVVSPSLTRAGAAATTTSGSEHNHKWSVDLRSKRFDQAVSLDAFVGLMTDLLAAEPSVRFFVASNSAQAKNRIVRHFGAERVLTLDENARLGERESAHSIVVAAAEFHLLGMTDLVVHTRGSSFAREAAARTGIPVIDVSDCIDSVVAETTAAQTTLRSFEADPCLHAAIGVHGGGPTAATSPSGQPAQPRTWSGGRAVPRRAPSW